MRARRSRGRIFRVTKSSRKATYTAYMRSPHWKAFKAAWWATYDSKYKVRRCYVCGITQTQYGKVFDVHHRTYERFGGNERFTDCVPVCRPDHNRISREWRARTKTGLTMTLWELTSLHRQKARLRGTPTTSGTRRRSSDGRFL